MKYIAVDWSGAEKEKGQLDGIWLAVAEGQSLARLMNGLTREEVCRKLIGNIESGEDIVVGLDFAFSFPEWYFGYRGISDARCLWNLAAAEGERWLEGNTWPFWGRPGPLQKRPSCLNKDNEYRQTDLDLKAMGCQPKSVFQTYGNGAVGTGSIRGLPFLPCLRDAGFSVWPFDAPRMPLLVEIYPRCLYGRGLINNMTVQGRDSRRAYIEKHYPNIELHWVDIMIGNDNAFDAGISALEMCKHAQEFAKLPRATAPPKLLEGEIWRPGL